MTISLARRRSQSAVLMSRQRRVMSLLDLWPACRPVVRFRVVRMAPPFVMESARGPRLTFLRRSKTVAEKRSVELPMRTSSLPQDSMSGINSFNVGVSEMMARCFRRFARELSGIANGTIIRSIGGFIFSLQLLQTSLCRSAGPADAPIWVRSGGVP